jgi:hypothetical protein
MFNLYADNKKKRIYVIDSTTKKVYSHPMKPFPIKTFSLFFILSLSLSNYLRRSTALDSLGLNNLSLDVKILLGITGIIVGGLCFFLVMNTRDVPSLKKYLRKYPQNEEIKDRKRVLRRGVLQTKHLIHLIMGFLVTSLVLYTIFISTSSFYVFLWAFIFFMMFSGFCPFLENAVFLRKLEKYCREKSIINDETKSEEKFDLF